MGRAAVAAEVFAGEGLVHKSVDRLTVAHQRDQRTPGRHAGDERFGAVDRIEHPDVFGVSALVAELFADHAVLGEVGPDQRPHGLLCRPVGRRHRVEVAAAALVLDAQRGAEERQQRIAGRRGELVDKGCEIYCSHAPLALVTTRESKASSNPCYRENRKPLAVSDLPG